VCQLLSHFENKKVSARGPFLLGRAFSKEKVVYYLTQSMNPFFQKLTNYIYIFGGKKYLT